MSAAHSTSYTFSSDSYNVKIFYVTCTVPEKGKLTNEVSVISLNILLMVHNLLKISSNQDYEGVKMLNVYVSEFIINNNVNNRTYQKLEMCP